MEKNTDAGNESINAPGPRDYAGDPSSTGSINFSEALKHDKALVENWMQSMNSLSIFSVCFGFTVMAFILDGYKHNLTTITLALLAQDSHLHAGVSNSSHILLSEYFQPVRANVLWFLSLALDVTCGLSAILVRQWSRNYIQAVNRQVPVRAFLPEEKSRMRDLVTGISILLQIAMLLFLAGLIDDLFTIDTFIASALLGITVILVVPLIILTILLLSI